MISSVHTAYPSGIETVPVKVEIDVRGNGLPKWAMVGMLETAVKESRERITSAFHNSGFVIPNRKTTVNLYPAGIKKCGAGFDLPIAIGLLIAWEKGLPEIPYLIAGELSLTGEVLPIPGALLIALTAKELGLKGVIVPRRNLKETELVCGIETLGVSTLKEAADYILHNQLPLIQDDVTTDTIDEIYLDMRDVRGQTVARRGLEIASAGNHHILMMGPPGAGKSMLAERLPGILPPPTKAEQLEIVKIASALGSVSKIPPLRPFRSPHHSASYAGLVGGGSVPQLGEISLAHGGVLFLDELGEFRRDVVEMIRQPLESGKIQISRSGKSITHPARFLLVAATNPCRCGYLGHPRIPCTCTMNQIHAYRSRLSGPLLDRIDIQLDIPPIGHRELWAKEGEESSTIRERIIRARKIQYDRYEKNITNSQLDSQEIQIHCKLGDREKKLICDAADRLALSARAITRIIKVSRTIADIDESELIKCYHIEETLSYRAFDRMTLFGN